MTDFLAGTLLALIPLMFTALGETISERGGVLNIGLEGMMLMGAYTGFLGAYYADNEWVGFVTGVGGGMLVGLVMAVLCVHLGLDQIVIGIALTLSVEGITSVLHGSQFGTSYPRLGSPYFLHVPLLGRIPWLGDSVFNQPPIVYVGFALIFVTAWAFRHSNPGLNLKAAGEKPAALDAAGVSVFGTRTWAVLCTGALAGLGGAYLSIAVAGVFTPFLTQGQGFMAIVIAMLGRGRPTWVLGGSILFGAALQLETWIQVDQPTWNIPIDVVNMLPFVAVVFALIAFGRRSYLPPALAIPYVRGAR